MFYILKHSYAQHLSYIAAESPMIMGQWLHIISQGSLSSGTSDIMGERMMMQMLWKVVSCIFHQPLQYVKDIVVKQASPASDAELDAVTGHGVN